MLVNFARLHKCNVRRSYPYIMERYIILTMQDLSILDSKKNPIDLVRDIAECDEDDCLIVFKSFDEAVSYQEANGVSGQVVELPLW